jgi:putative addiction module killer protein
MFDVLHYLGGDHRPLREGIQELRIDVGKAYRVYFAYVGEAVILLTCGGSKQTQDRVISLAIKIAA